MTSSYLIKLNFVSTTTFFVLTLYCVRSVDSSNQTSEFPNVSATMRQVLNGYDKNMRPLGASVTVKVTLFVSAFGDFDSQASLYDINFYLRQTWKDGRLSFRSNSSNKISLTPAFLQKVWIPDTTFVNVKEAKLHFVTSVNQLVHLSPDGTIMTSMRVTAKVYCQMELHRFPFDEQKCNLIFGSYGYNKGEIDYVWKYENKEENIKFGEHAKLKQFTMKDSGGSRTEKDFGETGIFTKLSLEFTLKREIGFYIINVYFPASLLVVLSWVSFWLRRDQTPARVALGITTALTLMTLISGAQSYMPKVPYIRAIDWFLIICFICVIGALLEYSAVHYFDKDTFEKDNNYQVNDFVMENVNVASLQARGFDGLDPKIDDISGDQTQQSGSSNKKKIVKKVVSRNVNTIEKISRWAFPLFFIVLNAIYWSRYLT